MSAYVNYTEEYKSKQLEQAWQVYLNRLEETKAAILERLEDIRKAEKYNEEIIEIDSVELANALAIIEAVKDLLNKVKRNF